MRRLSIARWPRYWALPHFSWHYTVRPSGGLAGCHSDEYSCDELRSRAEVCGQRSVGCRAPDRRPGRRAAEDIVQSDCTSPIRPATSPKPTKPCAYAAWASTTSSRTKAPRSTRRRRPGGRSNSISPAGERGAADFQSLFEQLGFRTVAEVRKHRRTWLLDWQGHAVEAALDEVDRVGTFVELESPPMRGGWMPPAPPWPPWPPSCS